MILERLVVTIDSDLTGLRNITAGAARMERDVQRNMTRAGDAADRFADRLSNVGTKLTLGPTLAVGALGTASVIAAAKLEQLRMGLDAVTGGGAETERQLLRLRDVSKLPGLGFEEAVRGSINLQAAGFSAEAAERALRGFGNALATVGRGRAELDGVILALGQIAAKGKIMAQEVNQLAERVPQIRKVMEAAFGTADTEKLQKMGLDATTFVDKVVTELLKLPPVTTGIANSFENITDQSKITADSFGQRLVPAVTSLMDVSSGALGVLERMPPTLKDLSIGAAVGAAALGPLILGYAGLIRLAPLLATHWAALAAAGGPILGVAAAIGAVTAAGMALSNNWPTIRYEALKLADALRDRLKPATEGLADAWQRLNDTARPVRVDTGDVTRDLLDSMRFGGEPGKGVWQVPLAAASSAAASTPTGPSPVPFHITAQAVDMLIDRQKKLREEAAKLHLDRKLAEGTTAADDLKTKIAEVERELARVNALLATPSGKVWAGLKEFVDNTKLTEPDFGLLRDRGFKLPALGGRTSWKLELDPKTGLQAWKRITEGGIPVNLPKDLKPTTRAPQGTGAASATVFDDIKGTITGAWDRLIDPQLIFSNLVSGGLQALLGKGLGLLGSAFSAVLGGLRGGGDDRQAQMIRDALARNREAIERNTQALAGKVGGLPGADINRALGIINRMLNPGDPVFGRPFQPTTEELDFLRALAKDLGLSFLTTVEGLQQFRSALEDVVADSLKGFEGGFGLLRQEFDLLDITDPLERFRRSIDFMAGIVSPGLGMQLAALTPDTFDAFIRSFLASVRDGTFDLGSLGGASLDQFLQALGFVESNLDRLGETTSKVNEALRNVPAGFKVQLARYRADTGLDAPPTFRTEPRGGGGGFTPAFAMAMATAMKSAGTGQNWTFTGPIYVQADDPDEMIEKIEAQMQWRQRTGAYVIPTTTRRD